MNGRRHRRPAARVGGRRRGSVLAELVIVLPILVLVTAWMIQLSWLFFIQHTMVLAAREGARAMSVQNATTAQAKQKALACLGQYGTWNPADFTVVAEQTPTNSPTDVRVTITIPVSKCIIGTKLGLANKSLAARAVMKLPKN